VLAASLLVLAPSSAALSTTSTYYAGANSQGQKLLFTVDQTSSGPMFDPIFINQIDRCPVTGDVIGMEFSFQGFLIPIKNGKFSLTLNDLSNLLRWNGTVTSTGATGKESIDLAGFDSSGGLQDCGAGSLAWKAQALVPASSITAPKAKYVVSVTKEANGSVHYSVSH
jgi:hypothetical protein